MSVNSEKRNYSRLNVSFPIKVTPDFLGTTVDLSMSGLGFVFDKPLLISPAKAEVMISSRQKVELDFKVIWGKHLVKGNKFAYGAAFIRLGERQLDALRELAISNEVESFLNKTDNNVKDSLFQFFLHDVKNFMKRTDELQVNGETWMADEQDGLDEYSHKVVAKGESIVASLDDRRVVKSAKAKFRKLVAPLAYKSLLMKQGIEKPYGYPGDYDVIEKIYNNKPLTDGVGKYFDLIFLNNPYARAVRGRKEKMKEILIDFIKNTPDPINVLNFGCGPCREIRELFIDKAFKTDKKINFKLLDQDKHSLDYSKSILGDKMGNLNFEYLQYDAFSFPDEPAFKKLLGKIDLVYSIGLADYLPDRVLKRILKDYFELVKANGEFIIAHKDRIKDPNAPIFPDWFCDWHFVPRNEEVLVELIDKIGLRNMSVRRDIESTGKIIFLRMKKEAGDGSR